jgi:RNA polymerase sigma factor (sigma-70 family)
MSPDARVAADAPVQLESLELVRRCAEDTGDAVLWTEFLRRFGPRIKQFIRGTTSVYPAGRLSRCGAAEEADLFQGAILRLVANDCAPLKRFTGRCEADLLAYLAIIVRSSVRDFVRRQHAQKRFRGEKRVDKTPEDMADTDSRVTGKEHQTERKTLIGEVNRISSKVVGIQSTRDRLIFDLYYSHDLSAAQISECRGIGLTRRGVDEVLVRLTSRVRRAAAGPEPAAE